MSFLTTFFWFYAENYKRYTYMLLMCPSKSGNFVKLYKIKFCKMPFFTIFNFGTPLEGQNLSKWPIFHVISRKKNVLSEFSDISSFRNNILQKTNNHANFTDFQHPFSRIEAEYLTITWSMAFQTIFFNFYAKKYIRYIYMLWRTPLLVTIFGQIDFFYQN